VEAQRFFIDDELPVPIFAQLCEQVLAAVARGELRAGEQLPSVRDVAAALSLNPNTVNRAWAELERDGVVETRRGLGTFVSAKRAQAARERAPRLDALAQGFVGRATALGYEGEQIVRAVRAHVQKRRPVARRK